MFQESPAEKNGALFLFVLPYTQRCFHLLAIAADGASHAAKHFPNPISGYLFLVIGEQFIRGKFNRGKSLSMGTD